MLKSKRTWIIASIVFGSWLVAGILFFLLANNTEFTKSGQLGDSFGILNCLFSGLAFAGVIITLMFHDDERKKDAIVYFCFCRSNCG